jgi:aryl-alcohol dehydrogenase-like predicted oxidoreductase
MDYVELGRTGLRASVAGLGCGGFSRLGLAQGKSEADAVALIHAALDEGVTLFDTAASYGTEVVLGKALRRVPRDRAVIATKAPFSLSNRQSAAASAVAALDESLRRLGTDYIDIYQLHGVPPDAYDHVREAIVPALLAEKAKGKFRHLGITETAPGDPSHAMLRRAAVDGAWEVAMVGFHMMHRNAREAVFPLTRAQGVGTLIMFAVRNIFSRPERLAQTLRELAADGVVPAELARSADPLGFLVHEGGASTVPDAAYRFARHEAGADVVLFGTGDPAHLRTNIASILKPPLPAADLARLESLFGALVGVGLDAPHLSRAVRTGSRG